MHETPGAMPGVSVQLGGERDPFNRIRPILKASPAARLRLEAQLFRAGKGAPV